MEVSTNSVSESRRAGASVSTRTGAISLLYLYRGSEAGVSSRYKLLISVSSPVTGLGLGVSKEKVQTLTRSITGGPVYGTKLQ
jgi:hypothetical protein